MLGVGMCWGGGVNQHMENSICFMGWFFIETFPNCNQEFPLSQLGKLSKLKTTKHMEFSICWLTPPPNIWKILW